jgi:hypothetical protein
LRPFFVVAFATLTFCPLDGGSDEFVGGLPARPLGRLGLCFGSWLWPQIAPLPIA